MRILLIISLICLCSSQVFAATGAESQFAQVEAQLKDILDKDPDAVSCRQKLVPIYDLETIQFLTFLEDHFQNKSSSTTLLNTAIVRYRGYKTDLESHFQKIQPVASSYSDVKVYEQYFNAYTTCEQLTTAYLEMAKDSLIAHAQRTSNQKRTTILIEKYKSINDKMRDLNFEIAQMYGHFLTFENKLPGFTQQCIQE